MQKLHRLAWSILILLSLLSNARAALSWNLVGLRPAWVDNTTTVLTWTGAADALSYNVYRYDEAGATWTLIASGLTEAQFREDPAPLVPPLYYSVTAVTAEGESSPSTTSVAASGQSDIVIMLYAPGDFGGTLTSTNASLAWAISAVSGADGILEIGTTPGEYPVVLIDTNYAGVHQFFINDLTPSTIYYYRITTVGTNRLGHSYQNSFATPYGNRPPVAQDVTVGQMGPWGTYVPLVGTDPDFPFGGFLTYRIETPPTNGMVYGIGWSWNGQYSTTYSPNPHARGEDHFTFVVNDGFFDSVPGVITITNIFMNDAPVAGWTQLNCLEDSSLALTLPGSDADGDPLTFTVSYYGPGTLTGTAPDLVYTPPPNYHGGGSISYSVTDGFSTPTAGWLEITVVSVNDAPIADNLVVTIQEDQSAPWISPTFTDVDGSGSYTSAAVTQPMHGSATNFGFGLIYTPEPNFSGTDSFNYVIWNEGIASAPATVQVNVQPMNDQGVLQNQSVVTLEDVQVSGTVTVIDVENDAHNLALVSFPTNGVVQLSGMGFTYKPTTNYTGLDAFRVRATDVYGMPALNVALVQVSITPVNDAPVANAQSLSLIEDGSKSLTLTGSDIEGSGLTARVMNGPAHGTLSGTVPTLVYTPVANFNGTDSFAFVVNDGTVDSAVATVNFTVTAVNDAPTANAQSVNVNEDGSINVTLAGGDVEGSVLSFTVQNSPAHGTLSGTAPNLVYAPTANFSGADSFTFAVNDGTLTSAPATININVTPANDAPVANPLSVTLDEDTSASVSLTGSDIEGGALTAMVMSGPAHGTLSGTSPNFVYTPAANFSGADSFTFVVNDGALDSPLATVNITVTAVNDAPVANPLSVTLDEDTSASVSLTGSDVEGVTVTAVVQSGPTHGTVSGTSPNLVYTPAANFYGMDSLTFVVNDGVLNSAVATVTITVTPANDVPVANDQSLSVDEDSSVNVTLTGSDIEEGALTAMVMSAPIHGTLTGTPPDLIYTPAANFNGTDTFTYVVNDGTVDSAPATVNITVTPVNDAPVANSQSITLDEDSSVNVTLTGSDMEGSALAAIVQSGPSHGALSGTSPNLVYTPEANFQGTDSLTFVVNDGVQNSANATVTITVTPANDAPVANDQSITVGEDASASVTLTGSDIEEGALTTMVMSGPTHGTLSGTLPDLIYTPDANFNGTDSFTFVVNDGALDSVPATVTITVTPVNDAPVANPQSIALNEDSSANVSLTGSDADGTSLTAMVQTSPAHGSLSGTLPNLIYTPAANFNGTDSFTFVVNDGSLNSAVATVNITVTPVNDPPVANAQSITLSEDASKSLTLTGSDLEGSAVTARVVSGPEHGALSGTLPNLVYTPAANFNGPDSFTFVVNDGTVDSAVATVSITVTPVNDAPVATSQSVTLAEDSPYTFTSLGSDVDGNPLTTIMQSGPAHGTLSGTLPSLVYTPAANYYGPDSFTFILNDGTISSGAATVSITVTSVNDAPVANAQSITLNEDATKSLTLAGSDLEGSAVTARVVNGPAYGILTGTAPNLVYKPATNYCGADSFTFVVNDGANDSAPATVTITVNPINDAPLAVAKTVTTAYNTPVSFTITGTDVDGNPLTFVSLTSPNNGTLTGTAPNLTFTPKLNWSGTTTFTFKVNDGVVTSSSATVTIIVAAPTAPPAAPSNLSATALSNSQIRLTWTDNDVTEAGFKIERSVDEVSWSQIGTVASNVSTYTSSGLTKNKKYYYRVRAYNTLGDSPYSNTASATTLP